MFTGTGSADSRRYLFTADSVLARRRHLYIRPRCHSSSRWRIVVLSSGSLRRSMKRDLSLISWTCLLIAQSIVPMGASENGCAGKNERCPGGAVVDLGMACCTTVSPRRRACAGILPGRFWQNPGSVFLEKAASIYFYLVKN